MGITCAPIVALDRANPILEALLKRLRAEVRRGKLPPPTLLVNPGKYSRQRVVAGDAIRQAQKGTQPFLF